MTNPKFPVCHLGERTLKQQSKFAGITFLSCGKTVLMIVGLNVVSLELCAAGGMSAFDYNTEPAKINTNLCN